MPRHTRGSGDHSSMRRAGRGRPSERRPRPRGRGSCARVAVGGARTVHVHRANAAGVGQVPLCIWAERGFGPEALKLIFLFSDLFNSLQIQKFV
jgi:hypothetical protein